MDIDFIENVFMILASVIGLLSALFYYIETPKRGLLYINFFFLSYILSDYYWAIYTFVVGEDPDASALMAYFGWNLGYFFLLLAILKMEKPEVKRYIHPLMFVPIPLNILQFLIYLPFGGLWNNIYQGLVLTAVACLCLRGLLYYFKYKEKGEHFPLFHLIVLLFIFTEYGMWTASCFSFPSAALDPYYYFSFTNHCIMTQFAWSISRDYAAEGLTYPEKNAKEKKFEIYSKIAAVLVFVGGGLGGYGVAVWIRNMMGTDTLTEDGTDILAMSFFMISVVLVLLTLAVLGFIMYRYRAESNKSNSSS